MILGYHGGRCCGIKTIYDLYSFPASSCHHATYNAISGGDGYHSDHPFGESFFIGKVPDETAEKRFDRYIEYADAARASGLIEVTTTSAHNQTKFWSPVLKGHGFTPVTVFRNSNSGCRVTVWHRVTPVKEAKPQPPLAEIL